MQSKATTVEAYLAGLPADRREAVQAVRRVVLDNLDKGYIENMSYGMIGYCVPHSIFPAGYHCDPKQALPFAALASQKNHLSLYLMCLYGHSPLEEWFREAWAKTGKKLDMGKSCIRFKKVDDLALDVIAEAFRRIPAKKYVEIYERSLQAVRERPTKGPPKKAATKKARAKKSKTTSAAKARPSSARKKTRTARR